MKVRALWGTVVVGPVAGLVAAGAVVLAVLTALAAAGCDMPSTGGLGQVGGSGVVVTESYDYAGFTRVVVDSGFEVEIDSGGGDAYQAWVTVDDNLVQEHLQVELDGDTLRIGLAPHWNYHDVTVKARVALPRLAGLDVSGSSSVVVTGLKSGAALELVASGSSAVEMAGVSFGDVGVDVSGASRVEGSVTLDELAGEVSGGSSVRLAGAAAGLRLEASGGSRLDLLELRAESGDLTLSGGSNGQVTVTGSLSVDASGGSLLEYAGDPQVSVDASGGSDVEPY
jgi:hypothetical protein